MLLITDQTFPTGYKPNIYYGNFTVKYYPAKYRDLVKSKPETVKQHVKEFACKEDIGVLADDFKFADKSMHNDFIRRAWATKGISAKLDEQFAWVSKIEVLKDLGKVNYEFKQKT